MPGKGQKRKHQQKQAIKTPSSKANNTKSRSNKDDGSSQNLESLISNLAKQVADPEATKSQTSKADRIEKRVAKQQRRKERKEQQHASQEQTTTTTSPNQSEASKKRAAPNHQADADSHVNWRTTLQSRKRLKYMTGLVKQTSKETKQQQDQHGKGFKNSKRGPPTPFQGFDLKKRKTKKWDEENVQPRPKDYGGLGLALPSLFLSFEDPSFIRRLEDEFQEHIDGFFGKQRTKAMKKQLDGGMLWRKMSMIKKDKNQKVDGKKLADMTPDQRVEAMLKAGLL